MEWITGILIGIITTVGGWFSEPQIEPELSGFSDPFLSIQLAENPQNGYILQTDGTDNSWVVNSGGGGGGSGLFSTSTDNQVVYNNTGDAVVIEGTATSSDWTSEGLEVYDGALLHAPTTIMGTLTVGDINATSTSPSTFAGGFVSQASSTIDSTLRITGDLIGDVIIDASYFVATSTTATSTFAGGLEIETTGFVYDSSSNYVGIGTATPSDRLTVNGNILASDFYTTSVADLQTAITNASTGDVIYVKNESASVDQINILSKNNIVIDGQGAILTLNNGTNDTIFNISGGSRITIRNFTLVGPNTGTYNATNPHRGIVVTNNAEMIFIENNRFTQFDSQGIYVDNVGGTGDTSGVTIDRNLFYDFTYDNATNAQSGIGLGNDGEYTTIINSRFDNIPTAIRGTGANLTIRNNVITHSNSGSATGAAPTDAGLIYLTAGTNSSKVLIDGNLINHNDNNIIPINLIGDSSKPQNSFVVSNNYVLVNTSTSDGRQQFRGSEIDNSVISNNSFRPSGLGYSDVVVEVINSENVSLVGNHIRGGTHGVGISATSGNTTNVQMFGNSITAYDTAPTTKSGAGTTSFETSVNAGSDVSFLNNFAIGTTTPYSKLSIWADGAGTGARVFEITDSASSTLFTIDDSGNATTTGYLAVTSTSATSTFANGLDLSGGCFSINGNCLTEDDTWSFAGWSSTTPAVGSSIYASSATSTLEYCPDRSGNVTGIRGRIQTGTNLTAQFGDGTASTSGAIITTTNGSTSVSDTFSAGTCYYIAVGSGSGDPDDLNLTLRVQYTD